MDSVSSASLKELIKCCSCNCSCSTWNRSVKRKLDLVSDDPAPFSPSVARVEIENECVALRELLARQQQTIQELNAELEEERNASASATTEAMSMILKLQREKAEAQMEARQYKRFAEEKMAHDQQELLAFEDLLYKRDQVIQSLNFEVQAYKHRLMSFGYSEAEADAMLAGAGVGVDASPHEHVCTQSVEEDVEAQVDTPQFVDYPPLKCNLNEPLDSPNLSESSPFHIDKFAFGETPHAREQLQELDDRINQLERTPTHSLMDGEHPSTRHFVEKVGVGQSPRRPRHPTRFSTDSFGRSSSLAKETGKDWSTMGTPKTFRIGSIKKKEDFSNMENYCSSRNVDNASDLRDDTSDRICTIDSVNVHSCGPTETKASVRICKDDVTTPRESLARVDTEETDVNELYMRLEALEAERDSMRQEFVSMKTDQARLIFMKAIAHHMSQKMSEGESVPAEKPSPVGSSSSSSSSTSALKWVKSLVSWRRRARQSKYTFGQSDNNVGLLLLLDQKPHVRQWRCLTRTSATEA